MVIGSLGMTIFSVSTFAVKTLSALTIDGTAKWNELSVINGPIKLQFAGSSLDQIKFNCSFSETFKVKPLLAVAELKYYMKKGKVLLFILGGRKVGSGKYVITSLLESHKTFDEKGRVISIDISVTLKEYI